MDSFPEASQCDRKILVWGANASLGAAIRAAKAAVRQTARETILMDENGMLHAMWRVSASAVEAVVNRVSRVDRTHSHVDLPTGNMTKRGRYG